MGTAAKVIVYTLFMLAAYCVEYDVPVMFYYKRARYLTNWKLAAWAQRKALDSYAAYVDEAEYSHG